MKNLKKQTPYSKIILRGKSLTLRAYKFSDFKICQASHLSRLPSVNKFDTPIPISKDPSYDQFKERITRYKTRAKNNQHFVFGLFDKKTNAHIGHVDLLVISQEVRWGNLGYHIQNQYFNKGYASEGCKLALKAAFEFLNFHRIEASMEIANKPSRAVAVNIGLDFEGKRKKFFPKDGGLDMWVYATNAIDYKS
jgi:ribosomal-protein-alanine N-acetyltransferase